MNLRRECFGVACAFAGAGFGLLGYTFGALNSVGHPINAGVSFAVIGISFGLAGLFGGVSQSKHFGEWKRAG